MKKLGSVLILNGDYTPIGITTVETSMKLYFTNKVDIVEASISKMIHSVTQAFPWPTVIRVKNYVRLPHKKVALTKTNIIRRDQKCGYCENTSDLTIDHIVPSSRGGRHVWSNVIAACKKCNSKKDNMLPSEAGMELLLKPYIPHYIIFLKNISREQSEDWSKYLFA